MKLIKKIGIIIGGIVGTLVSYLLIYHCKRIFPEMINTFVIASLPWIGAVIGKNLAEI